MNRLGSALSPYLLQHAGQPVHWQPWDAAALAQAKREDKPILLSVGYAACHWCHVMAHESFDDADTAALMNADFVCIKVDREERPDLDRIYQAAHMIFTRRGGGWPLTMFLTPAGEPFFGGTYFPPEARHGLPAFSHILRRVAETWRKQRADIAAQNAEVLAALRAWDEHAAGGDGDAGLSDAPLMMAAEKLGAWFDAENGGFGGAPKFPHPVELAFCLHYGAACDDAGLLGQCRDSLLKMAAGGLQDHLGGGFFRYCVDARWQVPHFEKMGYDNGLLLGLYADAAVHFKEDALRGAVARTAEWVLAELRGAPGAFWAALDADSAGGEGAYYLWGEEELRECLTEGEYAVLAAHYGVAAAARVEGKVHLAKRQTVRQTAAACGMDEAACAGVLRGAEAKLLARRGGRERPATDDKILAAWNGLLIVGLARAARQGGRAEWLVAARAAFDAVWEGLRVDGRLRAARRGEQLSDCGFLDDCAFLLAAAMELLRAEFCPTVLAAAVSLAEELCAHYEDEAKGGFFFTANDGERLIRRIKSGEDNATPSGNGVAAAALPLLAQLTGEPRWQTAAERTLKAFAATLREQPMAHASLLLALQMHLAPPSVVLLYGDAALCRDWQAALEQGAGEAVVFCIPAVAGATSDAGGLPATLQKPAPDEGARAYVCDAQGCAPPVDSLAALQQLLEK